MLDERTGVLIGVLKAWKLDERTEELRTEELRTDVLEENTLEDRTEMLEA